MQVTFDRDTGTSRCISSETCAFKHLLATSISDSSSVQRWQSQWTSGYISGNADNMDTG